MMEPGNYLRNNNFIGENKMKTYKPDSAGVIYPYIKEHWNTQFRLEAELDAPVDEATVKKALSDIRKRFPTYFVKLVKRGQVYLLEEADSDNLVFEEGPQIFKDFDPEKEIPFRVLFFKNRLALEAYHILSDATGGLIFFKTLLGQYYHLLGKEIEYDSQTLCPLDEPTEEETGDPFLNIYNKGNGNGGFSGGISSFSYQYCPKEPRTTLGVTILQIPFAEIRALAKQHNTTLGVYIAALYIYSFYLYDGKNQKRDIRISMPIDLRRRFDIQSMRNFSLSSTLGISPKKENWTLEKIIETVGPQLQSQLGIDRFINEAYTNVSATNSKIFELIPVPLKKFAFSLGADLMGERLLASTFSNLGPADVPASIKENVLSLRMLLGEDRIKQINLSSTTYNGNLELIFTSRVENQSVQNIMETLLKESGVNIKRIERKVGSREYVLI